MNSYNRLNRFRLLKIVKRYAGGGGAATNSFYSKAYHKYPYLTSAVIASTLWATGDVIAQNLDADKKFKSDRFMGKYEI